DYEAWVAERLGTADERVVALPLAELVGQRFDDLNVLILRRCATDPECTTAHECNLPGIPDDQFAQPASGPVLLTHADVRAVALSRFRDLPPGPIWDIGAGLGGVAVELARALRAREVVAVERSCEQRNYLVQNRKRFGAYNMRIVAGEAPEALAQEELPAAVFLGGSGGRLEAILDLLLEMIDPNGCLVAHFVVLENLSLCLSRLRSASWIAETTLVQVAHSQPLAGLSALLPERPVWVVKGRRA
ncbi:MAG TPA: precorrin-6Y C5,15-methyltransferase (decarboxylating) subunit CbiT, partial [Isosphaeraceae bacterium]|nr:precorrin-6Y C5,15-methyltransferase (decarboxylating) subunit CbiT [Isosphaeraceae bacterium]